MWTIILLILILLVLIWMLISINTNSLRVEEFVKLINGRIYDIIEIVNTITQNTSEINKNIDSMSSDISNLTFQAENIEKHEIKEALSALQKIEGELINGSFELKEANNTLTSLESSMNLVSSHPAFSDHKDDDFR